MRFKEIGLQSWLARGSWLMLLGMALYPVSDAVFKGLMGSYSVPQTVFLRALFRLFPLLMLMACQGSFRALVVREQKFLYGSRLFVNFLYTYLFMYAYSLGSLTSVYALSYTSSLFLVILGAIVLKEKVPLGRWAAVIAGLLGVAIVVGAKIDYWTGLAPLVLIGALLGAVNKVCMRRLVATEYTMTVAFYPNLVMVIALLPIVFGTWTSVVPSDWVLFAVMGLITAAGQYVIAHALRYAEVSTLAPIEYTTLLWVVGLDWMVWGVTADLGTVIGALVIIGSNLYLYGREKAIDPSP